jgi:hypothetical protein
MRRVLAPVKCNLAEAPPALAYRIEATAAGVPRIAWEGATGHTADGLLSRPVEPEARAARVEAAEFLRAALAAGPRPAREVLAEARAAGLAEKTLRRAKDRLGVRAQRVSETGTAIGSGRWEWALPQGVSQDRSAEGAGQDAWSDQDGQDGQDGQDFQITERGHLDCAERTV